MKLKTPYKDLLPCLSTVERETLRADIEANGIYHPILVDEDGNILDGHNRYEIDPDAPVRVVSGLTESEKRAFVMRMGLNRRNLSPDQTWELRNEQKQIAVDLRKSDPGRWTQEKIARLLGISQQTVSYWFQAMRDTNACNADNPDARVKISKQERLEIKRRLDSNTSRQSELAKEFNVAQSTISRIGKELDAMHRVRISLVDKLDDDLRQDWCRFFWHNPDRFDKKKVAALKEEMQSKQEDRNRVKREAAKKERDQRYARLEAEMKEREQRRAKIEAGSDMSNQEPAVRDFLAAFGEAEFDNRMSILHRILSSLSCEEWEAIDDLSVIDHCRGLTWSESSYGG